MASTLNETVREDGLRIITKRLPYFKSVWLSVTASVGCADDGEGKEGFFHFFEHMAFKGTKTKDMFELKRILASFLHSNAFTEHTHTTYLLGGLYTKRDEIKNILFDMYFNPSFPTAEIDKEKGIVLREVAEWKDEDSKFAWSELYKLLWKSNPLRRVGVGTPEGMAAINQELLIAAHKQWYRPSNTIVMGVGNLKHEWLVEKAFEFFTKDNGKAVHPAYSDEADDPLLCREISFERKARENAVVLIGCKVPQYSERELLALKLLDWMFGVGFDSILFKEVRDKSGLAYATGSHLSTNPLGNCWGFESEVGLKDIYDTRKLMEEIICGFELDQEHLARMKAFWIENATLSLETPHQWELLLLNKLIRDGKSVESLNNYIMRTRKDIASVTFEEVCELRNKLLIPEHLACVILRPS